MRHFDDRMSPWINHTNHPKFVIDLKIFGVLVLSWFHSTLPLIQTTFQPICPPPIFLALFPCVAGVATLPCSQFPVPISSSLLRNWHETSAKSCVQLTRHWKRIWSPFTIPHSNADSLELICRVPQFQIHWWNWGINSTSNSMKMGGFQGIQC